MSSVKVTHIMNATRLGFLLKVDVLTHGKNRLGFLETKCSFNNVTTLFHIPRNLLQGLTLNHVFDVQQESSGSEGSRAVKGMSFK